MPKTNSRTRSRFTRTRARQRRNKQYSRQKVSGGNFDIEVVDASGDTTVLSVSGDNIKGIDIRKRYCQTKGVKDIDGVMFSDDGKFLKRNDQITQAMTYKWVLDLFGHFELLKEEEIDVINKFNETNECIIKIKKKLNTDSYMYRIVSVIRPDYTEIPTLKCYESLYDFEPIEKNEVPDMYHTKIEEAGYDGIEMNVKLAFVNRKGEGRKVFLIKQFNSVVQPLPLPVSKKLRDLKELLDEGILTQEEYDALKPRACKLRSFLSDHEQ